MAENLPAEKTDGVIWFTTDTGKLYFDAVCEGELTRFLINPELNWDDILDKNILPTIHYNSVEGFEEQKFTIPKAGSIYIYYDAVKVEGQDMPRIKIGDGTSYLADLPFMHDIDMKEFIQTHIDDTDAHVSVEDRQHWNDKVSVKVSEANDERIIFYN